MAGEFELARASLQAGAGWPRRVAAGNAGRADTRAVFERAPVAMGLVDARPGREWRLLRVNGAMEALCGVPRDDMTGRSTFEFMDNVGQVQNTALLPRFVSGQVNAMTGMERRIRWPDGRAVLVSVNSALVRDRDGAPAYFVAHLTDITRQRRAQERTRRAARSDRDVAALLREGLRPAADSRFGPVRVAARCLPADPGDVIGGDWYDAFALPDGEIGVVVGDVAGHGIGMAVAMTQLRHAARALALSGLGPAQVLRHLSEGISPAGRNGDPLFATVAYARLDTAAGTMRFASAGHPPLLVLTPAGPGGPAAVRALPGLGDPPAGIVRGHRYAEQATVFRPGEILIGFTDGLVERRRTDLDDGIRGLIAGLLALPAAVTGDPEILADVIFALAPPADQHDDTTVIVVAHQPGPG